MTQPAQPNASASSSSSSSSGPASRPRWLENPLLIPLLLAAVTFAVYLPALRCGFINCDDNEYVTENPHVLAGLTWAGVKWAFTAAHSSNWHPLTWLSHMLDCQLYGLHAWGHHLTNVLLHAANAALLFLLLRRLTGAQWRSALVAALFALHPLRVESVAWVAERKDVLSTCFGLLSLICYARYAQLQLVNRKSKIVNYSLALLFFICSLLSKPMFVTLPFVMLLLDYWPLGRFKLSTLNSQLSTFPRLIAEKSPFLILSILSSIVTFIVQRQSGVMQTLSGLSLSYRISNTFVSYARYLGKLFWPAHLAFPYPLPDHWPLAQIIASAALVVGVTLLACWWARARPWFIVGWLWFLGMLIPVIGLVQVGTQSMADHYTYLPLIGVTLIVVWGASEILFRSTWFSFSSSLARHSFSEGGSSRIRTTLASLTALVILAACAARTSAQIPWWTDSGMLFSHALALTENNFIAHKMLGDYQMEQGKGDAAIDSYRAALQINTSYVAAHINLGLLLAQHGNPAEAESQYLSALFSDPGSSFAHNDLGFLYINLGRYDEAKTHLQAALQIDPQNPQAYYNLGNVFNLQHQYPEAIAVYQQALRFKPDYPQVYNNLGAALGLQGRVDESIAQYRLALKYDPDFVDARKNLGLAFVKQGRYAEAVEPFRFAVEHRPDDAVLRYYFGGTLAATGHRAEAIVQLTEALRLHPGYPEATEQLRQLEK